MKENLVKKNLTNAILSIAIISSYSTPFNVHADTEDEDDISIETNTDQSTENQSENVSKKRIKPSKKAMSAQSLTMDDEFRSFKNGRRFRPPFPDKLSHRFGYEKPPKLFHDFHGDRCDEESNESACLLERQNSDQSSAVGSVKITSICDQNTYIYYSEIVNKVYSLDLPTEVQGKSCKIQVESVTLNSSETKAQVQGSETTEEVNLTDDTVVEVDIE